MDKLLPRKREGPRAETWLALGAGGYQAVPGEAPGRDISAGASVWRPPTSPVPEPRRSRSAGKSRQEPLLPRAGPARGSQAGRPIIGALASQMPGVRQKDKLVLLPGPSQQPPSGRLDAEAMGESSVDGSVQRPSIWEDLEVPGDSRGRITVYCIAERLDRKALDTALRERYPDAVKHSYPDVLHLENAATSDVFFFDFGVVCCWGLSQVQEQAMVSGLARGCDDDPLPPGDVEIDQFEFHYSAHEPPSMQNDTITVNRRQAADHQVKLAICHALAQSTKLSVYEDRVQGLVLHTKHLPEHLAKHGSVHISRKEVARLIGRVFLQRSAVNLLSTVLDTPEFFWSAPDHLQALYERACEYLELETRVEVLNARFTVLQEMLDMLRDHLNNGHASRLEWIIIWLIAVELFIGLLQLLGLFGIVGAGNHAGG